MSAAEFKAKAEDYLRSARIITGELQQEAEQVTNCYSRDQRVTEAKLQAQIAQAEATLYAAEQQRIANLIALGLGASSPNIREGLGLS